jgi:hypothetical protein
LGSAEVYRKRGDARSPQIATSSSRASRVSRLSSLRRLICHKHSAEGVVRRLRIALDLRLRRRFRGQVGLVFWSAMAELPHGTLSNDGPLSITLENISPPNNPFEAILSNCFLKSGQVHESDRSDRSDCSDGSIAATKFIEVQFSGHQSLTSRLLIQGHSWKNSLTHTSATGTSPSSSTQSLQ